MSDYSDNFSPLTSSLTDLAEEARHCIRCPLYKSATQTVFGEGPQKARMVLIGEQPGDQEDLQGHPFVGPAGQLLNQCLEKAGLDRKNIYITNVVKHFKWEPSGKRRLHKKPSAREIATCKPWLEAELHVIEPDLIVALGATAAQSLMGSSFRVTRSRGKVLPFLNQHFLATVHPSSLLRAPPKDRENQTQDFIDDLRRATGWMRRNKGKLGQNVELVDVA